MAERFTSLAAFVRAATQMAGAPASDSYPAPASNSADALPNGPSAARDANSFVHADLVTELSLMRLAALEALQLSVPRLLAMLARDVLGRELQLAAPDIDALVARALAAFEEYEPVAISVAPCDVARVVAGVPVRPDDDLRSGDLVIEVRDGAFESPVVLRLERALEESHSAV